MKGAGDSGNDRLPNKYELAILAAKEARRMNDFAPRGESEAKVRITLEALDRVVKGKVKFTYNIEEGRSE